LPFNIFLVLLHCLRSSFNPLLGRTRSRGRCCFDKTNLKHKHW